MVQFRYIQLSGNPSPGAKIAAFLVLALAMALVFAIVFLALSFVLIATPVFLALGFGYYLYQRFIGGVWGPRNAQQDGIIEGEFRVIDGNGRSPPPHGRG